MGGTSSAVATLSGRKVSGPDVVIEDQVLTHDGRLASVVELNAAASTSIPDRSEHRSPVRDHQILGWFDSEKPIYSLAKRALDLAAASLMLILLVPVLSIIALLLWCEGTRPILYRQRRIGRGERLFWMLKFRTMRPDRRRQRLPIDFPNRRRCLKVGHDPRITSIGGFIRRTSLDELPQLLNVIRGDMSLVGPRPELLEMLPYYEEDRHFSRHDVAPGLTGWWQITSRTTRPTEVDPRDDLETKARDDAYYVANRSLWLDLKILIRTGLVVVLGRGAL